jgi:hypothetical protein
MAKHPSADYSCQVGTSPILKKFSVRCRNQLFHPLYPQEEEEMKYLLLIYEDEKRFAAGYSANELAEYKGFGQKHSTAIKGGHALQPTGSAQTVRVRNGGSATTDGPFAETKEQLGGFYLIEADSQEQAAAIAAEIPAARYGSIEVRPIMVFS